MLAVRVPHRFFLRAFRSFSQIPIKNLTENLVIPSETKDSIKKKTLDVFSLTAKNYASVNMNDSYDPSIESPLKPVYELVSKLTLGVIGRRCEGGLGANGPCRARAMYGHKGKYATLCENHVNRYDPAMINIKKNQNPSILDVASAAGEPAVTIAKAMPSAIVYATDYSTKMVEELKSRVERLKANENISNLVVDVADGEDLKQYDDASMDAVTCTFGLMFMPSWESALSEYYRVLKRNGIMVASVWGPMEEVNLFETMQMIISAIAPDMKAVLDPFKLSPGNPSGQIIIDALHKIGYTEVEHIYKNVEINAVSVSSAWDRFFSSSPLNITLTKLEESNKNVREEAKSVFESILTQRDWIKSDGSVCLPCNKAILVTGRKM